MGTFTQHFPEAETGLAEPPAASGLGRRGQRWLNVALCAAVVALYALAAAADHAGKNAADAYAAGLRVGRLQMADTVGDAWAAGRRSALEDMGCPRSDRPVPRPMGLVGLQRLSRQQLAARMASGVAAGTVDGAPDSAP